MKWQAIAGVTNQVNEEAKNYLALKLQKDAAAQIPHLWSEFITETRTHLHESQNHIEVSANEKTGGFAACLKFDELHQDYTENNKPLLDYAMSKYDQRGKDILGRAKNPYSRKLLAQKIGSYRSRLASKINDLEISLIDGKRHSMFVDNSERLAKSTYENPELYSEHLGQLAMSLDALPLMPDKKDNLLESTKAKLAQAAAMGIIKQSPEEFLNSEALQVLKEDLPLNIRIKLESQAGNMIRQQQQMQQARVKSLSRSHFASILKSGRGIEGFGELAASSVDAKTLSQLQAKEELYQRAYLVSDQLKHASFANGAGILQEIKPQSGDHDYVEKEQIYSILQKQFQQQIKQAKDDPAKFVEELFAEDLPDNIPFIQKLQLRKQLQEQKGIPSHMQQYLMAGEKEEYIRRLSGYDANAIKTQLDSIMAIGEDGSSGNDYQIGLELLAEISKDLKLNVPVHFYAENHLYADSNKTRRHLANMFAQIIPIQKQLFSSATSGEKRELEEAINDNKIFKTWQHDVTFQQPYNIENTQLMRQGIRDLSRFYQLSHGMNLSKSVGKATKQMIEDCYMEPITGLHIPREIIQDGQIVQLEEEYISSSLKALQRSIIKDEIAYDAVHSFGYDCDEELPREKIQSVLKEGRWFLSPDHKQVYYAYEAYGGSYQSLMINEHEKLAFDLITLNEPETESARQARLAEEMHEIINLDYGIR